jgi:hypothetical protein
VARRGKEGDLRSKWQGLCAGSPEKKVSFAEVLKSRYGAGLDIVGRGSYYPMIEGQKGGIWSAPSVFWMYGAQGAEVEVDPDTGKVKVLRIAGAHDVGKSLNPVTSEGQIEGGMIHAMGPTLMEEMRVSPEGRYEPLLLICCPRSRPGSYPILVVPTRMVLGCKGGDDDCPHGRGHRQRRLQRHRSPDQTSHHTGKLASPKRKREKLENTALMSNKQ